MKVTKNVVDFESSSGAEVSSNTTRNLSPNARGKQKPAVAFDEQFESTLHDEKLIDDLVVKADLLYKEIGKTEKKLLHQRIEIGGILLKLKSEVGHGNFINKLREWNALKRISFSLSTADRAMAYAELDAAGKLRTVTNLAEAERIRKAEAARKKAEKLAASTDGDAEPEKQARPILTKERITVKAKQMSKPALDECRSYEAETKRLLLEEIIELLTEELEQCN